MPSIMSDGWLPVLLRGIVMGFSIAAPVGPIGMLVIRRTLIEGRRSGLATGLGAATADGCYGAVAALGLTAVSELLVRQQTVLRAAGGIFLIYLGARAFFSRPAANAALADSSDSTVGAWLSTFFLTLTNPMTILSFVAIFAGLGLASGGTGQAVALVLGVFAGSSAWWLLLTGLVGVFRQRFQPGALGWVNRISGAIIVAFGLAALLSAG